MRSTTFWGPALWAAFSYATPHFNIRLNSSSSLSSLSSQHPSSSTYFISESQSLTTSTSSSHASSAISSASSAVSSSSASTISRSSSSSSSASSTTSSTAHISTTSSLASLSPTNSTTAASSSVSTPAPTLCTGCVIEAIRPTTLSFDGDDSKTIWTDITVTETILTRTITYMDGTTIDTVVTEEETLTQTKTILVDGPYNQTIAHTTPVFTWVPAAGTTVTLEAGPTYVAYNNIFGGLDFNASMPAATDPATPGAFRKRYSLPAPPAFARRDTLPEPTCDAKVSHLALGPTKTEDYQYYIMTYTAEAPSASDLLGPVSLPPALVQYLKSNPAITSIFNGSDIATCTLRPTIEPSKTETGSSKTQVGSTTSRDPFKTSVGAVPTSRRPNSPPENNPPDDPENSPTRTAFPPPPPPADSSSPPALSAPITSTYISKTYESTSTHVTRQGCLRCSTPVSTPVSNPPGPQNAPPPQSQAQPGQQQRPAEHPNQNTATLDLPGMIASVVNNPQFTQSPRPQILSATEQSVTVGDSIVAIHPARPTQPSQEQNPSPQNQQNPNPGNDDSPQYNSNQPNPGVVIGSETLTPGQTTTMNGVEVIVPSQGGSGIIVGGSTIAVNPAPTGSPVLTVGDNTVTANPQGQFVVGTQTLAPGGPAITVEGSTLSLGASGTIAVVNGVTQTIGVAPAATKAPVLTVNGNKIPATLIGGSTQFVIAPSQTLTPGGALTVDGTTFSMPVDASGSAIVVNGVTSTLHKTGAPVITLNSQSVTASVADGTTAFILGPSQTLTPGGVITTSGTTFSMPMSASGSVIVVNGVTSTLDAPGLPIITLDSQVATATVAGGTTAFILGPGQTLTPGGAVTVFGTTFSMPESASGSVVVINGVTSTLGQPLVTSIPALTIEGKTYSATVRDDTTEYELGPGSTLKPGEAITMSGTTYSLDSEGTALVINGKTSSIPKMPASNSASTTASLSTSNSTTSSSLTTSPREPGNFIASGIGITNQEGSGTRAREGLDIWVERVIVGLAGWILMMV